MAECISTGGFCVRHMWPDLSTIKPLYDCVPRQWGPNGTADSWTRNVKSAEASHIKIASVPCQQTLTVGTWVPNSCQTYRTTEWGALRRWRGLCRGKPANRPQQQDNSSARVEEEMKESYYPAVSSLPPFSAPHSRVRKQIQLYISTHLSHTEAALKDEAVTDYRPTATKTSFWICCAFKNKLLLCGAVSCRYSSLTLETAAPSHQTVCVGESNCKAYVPHA